MSDMIDRSIGLSFDRQAHDPVLHKTLHGYSGAAAFWERLRRRGVSDEELTEAIGYQFGIYGGSSGPGLIAETHAGGSNPRLWIGTFAGQGKPTLRGVELLRAARRVLLLPRPGDNSLGFGQPVEVEMKQVESHPNGEAPADRRSHVVTHGATVQLGLF